MRYSDFMKMLGEKVAFRSQDYDIDRRCLSRWVQDGRLQRVTQGVYVRADAFGPKPWDLAKLLEPESYITGMWAFDYHGLLNRPAFFEPLVSATRKRSFEVTFSAMDYRFQKISRRLYRETRPSACGNFEVAEPVTALFDLYHRKKTAELVFPNSLLTFKFDLPGIRKLQFAAPHRHKWLLARLYGHGNAQIDQMLRKARNTGLWPVTHPEDIDFRSYV